MFSQKNMIFAVAFYCCIVIAIILLFVRFTFQNTERIQSQNQVYARDATQQKAARLAGQFKRAEEMVETYAYFLEQTLSSPHVTQNMLKEMEENSPFSSIYFTNENGVSFSADGKTVNSSDRNFYKEGMEGKIGISVVLNSRMNNKSVLGFFAPLKYENKIIGVLQGSYFSNEYIHNMLETSYFGHPCDVFLCMEDGEIVASTAAADFSGNIIDAFLAKNIIDAHVASEAREIFAKGGIGVFNCARGSSIDNLSIMRLPGHKLFLAQTFPQVVTQSMVENANRAGIQLETALVLLFTICGAILLVRASRQKKVLEKENREMGWVIEGLKKLFASRYCVSDLDNGQYAYVAGSRPEDDKFPPSGAYPEFIDHLAANIAEEADRQDFRQFFALDNVKRHLENTDSMTFERRIIKKGKTEWENVIAICVTREAERPVRVLYVRQNVTDLKNRELQTSRKISTLNRKEREYRLALASNARCSFEFNVSADRLEEDLLIDNGSETYSFIKANSLTLPCSMSSVFEALAERVLPECRDDFQKVMSINNLKEMFAAGKKEVDLDFWIKDKNGKELCLRQAFYLTKDDLTRQIMAMSVGRDITALVIKQHNETKRLEELLQAAENANKAKSTFLSNMSHDIRTPMNAIIGFTNIAAAHPDNRERVVDCLNKVLSSSNHLLSLINDILDMSRIESGELQLKYHECNISEIVHNLVNIIQAQVKAKNMQLAIDTHNVRNELVKTDPLKLNQVFINLLSNAVKYTPAGGKISFRISQGPGANENEGKYLFEVRDNGIGMAKDFLDHIFEPFTRENTTTRSGIEGTGLGMAITKKIVDKLGGAIQVESKPGMGTKFCVEFPFEFVSEAADAQNLEKLAGKKILVVDDDQLVCVSLTNMLEKLGLRSQCTTNGQEAAKIAEEAENSGDPFNAFIIDWQMPAMSGMDTARAIRWKIPPETPIIVLTAYDWSDIEEEARAAGVNNFCAKPMFLSDLKSLLLETCLPPQETEPQDTNSVQFENARILIVDDVEMNREIAEFVLVESGFTVECAVDGTDAVEMVGKSPEKYYDAILMDVQMPTMNGYEATRVIRNMARADVQAMPIIAMTANALEEDQEAALKAGMNAHIAKPLEIDKFFEVMRRFFARKN